MELDHLMILNDHLKISRINNFSIKILTTGIYADEVNIKKNEIDYGKHSLSSINSPCTN